MIIWSVLISNPSSSAEWTDLREFWRFGDFEAIGLKGGSSCLWAITTRGHPGSALTFQGQQWLLLKEGVGGGTSATSHLGLGKTIWSRTS